jgi:hypothetical protein
MYLSTQERDHRLHAGQEQSEFSGLHVRLELAYDVIAHLHMPPQQSSHDSLAPL